MHVTTMHVIQCKCDPTCSSCCASYLMCSCSKYWLSIQSEIKKISGIDYH